MAALSQEQSDKLLQFQDLSGIEDIDRCIEILQRSNWNIEVAVQSHFAPDTNHAFVPHDRLQARTPPVEHEIDHSDSFNVGTIAPRSWITWGYMVLTFPFRFVYTTVFDILRFAYRLLRPPEPAEQTEPIEDVRTFLQRFNEKYGGNHPSFFEGTYGQALNQAKQDLRFLLVCLHGDEHQDSDFFCRNTLCNPNVIEFLGNANFYTWICNVNSSEGYKVSRVMRESSYPFLGVIVLKRNKMTVVARIEGPIDPDTLIDRLTYMITQHQPHLDAIQSERDELAFNQSLREQQDRDYEESLRADQEKERRKREAEEEKRRAEEERVQREQAIVHQREELERKKEEMRTLIPPEPEAGDPDAVRLMLKLPSGVRLERRFNKNQSLKYLYYFVFVHESCPDDFQIVTNFPRRVLPCQPIGNNQPPTFEEFGLQRNQLLFIQDNEA